MWGGHRFKSGRPQNLLNPRPNCQNWGATWQPSIGPRGTFLFVHNMPRVTFLLVQLSSNHTLPHHQCHVDCTVSTSSQPHRTLMSACATCHPSSGDTCHLNIGQTVSKSPKMYDTWHHLEPPRVLYGHATSALYVLPRGSTDCPVSTFFTCLAIRTDRDNFRSRRPFETKRIALGS
jgi:hypothetical protein